MNVNLRAGEKVPQLEGLDQIRVPNHATILHADLVVHLINLLHLADTLVQALLGSEHADFRLHGLLHGQSDLSGALGAIRGADLVEDLDVVGSSVGGKGLQLVTGVEVVSDGVRHGTAEDDEIQQRVGTQTVGSVNGHTGSLTAGEQTGDDLVVALLVNGENLTGVSGRDTTHVVVDGGQDGDGLLSDVDASEDTSSLRDTRQTLSKDLSGQVAQLEEDVVLLSSNTATVTDLHGHGSRHNISRGEILGSGGISLHETLTLRVEEVTTLTTGTFGDQATSSVDTSGVELDELEILVGETGTSNHGHTVTSASVRRCAAEVGSTITTSGQNSVVGKESVQGAVLLVVGEDTTALTILHDQIQGEVLDEVVGVVSERLAVKSVEKSVTGSISSSTASVGLATLAVLLRLATKGSLVTNC